MKKNKIVIYSLLIIFLTFSLWNYKVAKAEILTKTKVLTIGPFQDNGSHDYTVNIPDLKEITSIKADAGDVLVKSINGKDVVITVLNGVSSNMMTLIKDIEVTLPIPDRTEVINIDDIGNTALVHYPRNENWFIWTEDSKNPGTYLWGTKVDGYHEFGIREGGNTVISAFTSKQGKYTDSEGYLANYSDFERVQQPGWFPRTSPTGFITSNGTQRIASPLGEPSSNTDKSLLGYSYMKISTYNYSAHVHATGTKQVPANGYSYNVTITYTTLDTPICEIIAPISVKVGDDVDIVGAASSPNGVITNYSWSYYPSSNVISTMNGSSGTAVFNTIGLYNINLGVVDEKGMMATDTKPIDVIPPYPTVNIKNTGTLKENRKIVIDASSSTGGSNKYPIDWSKAKWNVTAISGGTSQDIKIQSHTQGSTDGIIMYDTTKSINTSLNTLQTFDVLFKKAGIYKFSCDLTNTYGNTGSAEVTLTITEDLAPVVNFATPATIYRDPGDNAPNGYAQATIKLTDDGTIANGSYSSDGDIIKKRGYFLVFDANNNNSYSDDMTYIYDLDYNDITQMDWNNSLNPHWKPIGLYKDFSSINIASINTGNLNSVIFKSTHVGKFLPGLFVFEEFGQECIPQFTSQQDRRFNMLIK